MHTSHLLTLLLSHFLTVLNGYNSLIDESYQLLNRRYGRGLMCYFIPSIDRIDHEGITDYSFPILRHLYRIFFSDRKSGHQYHYPGGDAYSRILKGYDVVIELPK